MQLPITLEIKRERGILKYCARIHTAEVQYGAQVSEDEGLEVIANHILALTTYMRVRSINAAEMTYNISTPDDTKEDPELRIAMSKLEALLQDPKRKRKIQEQAWGQTYKRPTEIVGNPIYASLPNSTQYH